MEINDNKEEEYDLEGNAEIVAFITIWDEDIGPVIVDFYPKFKVGDLENLAIQIFTAYQFFWDAQDLNFQTTKFILPIKSINRKAKVLLDLIPNLEVRGGLQPYIISLLLPDYFSDEELKIFDEIMLKISQQFQRNQKLSLADYYKEVKDILHLKVMEKEPAVDISEYYSYTAAMEDFQAGIKLFQTKNFDEAKKTLKKVLQKFEQEEHPHLIMEVLYILASLFTQRKQYRVARGYFLRLEGLAQKMERKSFIETSMFMGGFCAYKNENFPRALEKLESIEIEKVKYLNKLQFYTIYGKILIHFERFEEALEAFLKAFLVSTEMDPSLILKKQQSQILYELGVVNNKIAVEMLKNQGRKYEQDYKTYLQEAINHFNRSVELLIELKDFNILIYIYQLIGNIYDFLGEDLKFLEFYNKAFQYATEVKDSGKKIKITNRIIQKQTKLKMYEENIICIKNILKNIEEYRMIDLYSIARFHQQLGNALTMTEKREEGLEQFLKALEIFKGFKIPMFDELQLLQRIIEFYTEKKEFEKISSYSEELKTVSDQLHNASIQHPKVFRPMGEVKEIWVFCISEGIEFYNYAPFSEVDHDLLGGFLTAMQQFSLEISQNLLNSMIIGDDRYTFYQEEGYDFFILGRSAAKSSEEIVNKILSIIYTRFWKEFAEQIKNFGGNVTYFRRFTKVIEALDLTLTM